MRVSLRWLNEFVDLPTQDAEELANVFGGLGHEVEAIERIPLDFTGVVVARVESISPHPSADKVRLCSVSTGGTPVEVVCGAWNFEEGAIVAFAQPGARLVGGFDIGKRSIRGVESNGMICSESELGLGDDHSGILVLEPNTPLGDDFAKHVDLPDVVFDLSIEANRPDVMSMLGVARELSAFYQVPVRQPATDVPESGDGLTISVEIADPVGCNRFVARQLESVSVGASPLWMRRRLQMGGVRPINNIVDVTNYVMLELGQPLHAFDLDLVRGERIVVRRAHPGENLTTLDGVVRDLAPEDLVVADAEVASGLAGTMGGGDSEVSPKTTRVLLEGANWDPTTILLMAKWHGLRTEASARFERGVDPNLAPTAVDRAAHLMTRLAGGTVRRGAVDEVAHRRLAWMVKLPAAEVARILGPGFSATYCGDLLRRLHLSVEGTDPLVVTVPTYRPDLTRPIDLIEEIARLHGYDKLGERVAAGRGGGFTTDHDRLHQLRQTLIGAGLSQAMTLSFSASEDLDRMGYPGEHPARQIIGLRNPLRSEDSHLRTSLLPGLLRAAQYNVAHGNNDVAIFEHGKVFFDQPSPADKRIPDQPERLAWVVTGVFGAGGLHQTPDETDYSTSLDVWALVEKRLNLVFVVSEGHEAGFHPGRTAKVATGETIVGYVGEIHPFTAAAYGLEGRVAAGELDLAALIGESAWWQFSEPSPFPSAVFDLAFSYSPKMAASSLVDAVTSGGGEIVESISVFDEFSPGPDQRSIALRVTLRAPDRTLNAAELTDVRAAMIEMAEQVGGKLRGS